MADIDVVQKHRSGIPWLWWVVLAVVVIAVLWWAFGGTASEPTRVGEITSPIVTGEAHDRDTTLFVLDRTR